MAQRQMEFKPRPPFSRGTVYEERERRNLVPSGLFRPVLETK